MRLPVALFAVVLMACGEGAATTAPPVSPTSPGTPSGASDDSLAGRCLATAGAKRGRKPNEPAKIGAKHVLVKYAGAKKARETVIRTREEACLRAQEARAKLEEGMPWADVVSLYSEEPGATTREGSLGMIEREHFAPPFADAAFELERGQVSHVVETDFGFHVIMRTE